MRISAPWRDFVEIEGRPGAVPVSLQLIEPILQDIVEIGQAVFYKTIQPFESILSVGDLTLKRRSRLSRHVSPSGRTKALRGVPDGAIGFRAKAF